MTRRTRIFLSIGAGLAGLLLILVMSAVLVVRTAWFENYVREKIVAVTEESTGGKVEIGSFHFDWTHLTARIRNFVLHGTEPQGNAPLARIALLEVRLKLFSGLKKAIDLRYLGVDQPQVNVIVFPDGKTNIPEPKIKKQPSEKSGLETVVNLAIAEFRITNGLLEFSQQKTAFSARGENLRALLNYNITVPSYQGNLSIDPLLLSTGENTPLPVHVNIPVILEKDAVRVANASLNTDQSRIVLSGAVQDMRAPKISAQLKANVSLPEMQRSLNLPIDASRKGGPQVLTADLSATMDRGDNWIQVQTANVALGQSTFQAYGALDPSKNGRVLFNLNLALTELSNLLKVTTVRTTGALEAGGSIKLDAQNNYSVDGNLNSRGLTVHSGTTHLTDVSLSSPFHFDQYLISLDGLKLNALGGSLAAKIFVENMQRLSAEGNLRNIALPVLGRVLGGKPLQYDGVINGSIHARGDLKARGLTGYNAQTNLAITSTGRGGTPLSGRLSANYSGPRDIIDLGQSYIRFPNSRLDLSGSLNRQIDINLVSSNLNDFLPVANFASSTNSPSPLPVALQPGGTAKLEAQIAGNLSAPQISSHVAMEHFAIEQRSFDSVALDLKASPSGAAIQNGLLTRHTLRTIFDASLGLHRWKPVPGSPLAANLALRNADLADLLAISGEGSIPAAGASSAEAHIRGTYGNPLGNATLQVLQGRLYEQPFDRLYANINLADQLATLSSLEFVSAGGRIAASGTFQHPRESLTTGHAQFHLATENVQLANVVPLQRRSPGAAGAIQLTADAVADLRKVNDQQELALSNITADLSARGLRVQNQSAGDLTATVRTSGGGVNYNLTSDFAGSNIRVNGRTALAKDYPTTADASIRNLSVEKALAIAGQGSIPVTGTFSGEAHVSGTPQVPNGNLSFTLATARVYQEPINRLQGAVRYTNNLVDIPSIELDVPAGKVTLAGSFSHPAGDFNTGAVKLNLKSSDIQVAKVEHIQQQGRGMKGILRLGADFSGNLQKQNGAQFVRISTLNADASASEMRMNNLDLGSANLNARTTGTNLNFRFDSDIAQSQIHLSGASQLSGDYPTRANLTFSNIRYGNIAPFLAEEEVSAGIRPGFDALIEGKASLDGPILNAEALTGQLELSRLEARAAPRQSVTGTSPRGAVVLQNDGPVIVSLNRSVVQVQQLKITGPNTAVTASGSANFNNARSPLGITVAANTDLGLLQQVDRDFYSSGAVTLNATLRGTPAQPLVNGRVELKNASLNYADMPNGLSNANGVILLNGTNATIQNLTGESGGGKITFTGFAGYANSRLNFNFHAAAARVRVRYAGISATADAGIALAGTSQHSLVSGTVTVRRIAYGTSGDVGSMLSAASTPPTTPSAPSPFLTGMRLDIHILTATDLRVVTTYADRLAVEANLALRGTAARPGMLGHVTVTDGQLVFFGNTYTVTTGKINFYNPDEIRPVLNISLNTIAQNVAVTIGVSGPINNLKLTYTSDPPLTFEQIVQLLATNTTPYDPTIAAQQPTPAQQSFTQMGESALLGQAVADPVASRIQRVFGISQFKIDPSFSGSGGQPSARVTLQQKIANNITFTYITDVSQTNSQVVRIEWAFTPRFSAVGLRDYNGNVSVEFFYRFRKR